MRCLLVIIILLSTLISPAQSVERPLNSNQGNEKTSKESAPETKSETKAETKSGARPPSFQIGFPCDLKKVMAKNGGKLPPIRLTGETHGHPLCQRDRQYVSQEHTKDRIIEAVEASHLAFRAFEKYGIFGFDDDFAGGVTRLGDVFSLTLQAGQFGWVNSHAIEMGKREFIAIVVNHPEITSYWNKMRAQEKLKTPATHYERFIAGLIDDLILDPASENEVIETLSRQSPYHDLDSFAKVVERFLRFLGESISDNAIEGISPDLVREYIDQSLTMNHRRYGSAEQLEVSGDRFKKVWEEVHVTWRDPLMAKHLLRIYCSAAEKDKPLYITMGKTHVPGVLGLLQKAMREYPIDLSSRDSEASVRQLDELLEGKGELLAAVRSDYQHCTAVQNLLKERGLIEKDRPWWLRILHWMADRTIWSGLDDFEEPSFCGDDFLGGHSS